MKNPNLQFKKKKSEKKMNKKTKELKLITGIHCLIFQNSNFSEMAFSQWQLNHKKKGMQLSFNH